jgi:hypothetical protein
MDSATATLLILGSLVGVLATFPTGRTFLKDRFKGVIPVVGRHRYRWADFWHGLPTQQRTTCLYRVDPALGVGAEHMAKGGVFDFGVGLEGAYVVVGRERLCAGCLSDAEIDGNIQLLKDNLDAVAARMKAALRKQGKPPLQLVTD